MPVLKFISKIFSFIFVGLIHVYQGAISPLMPASCRHIPSCSAYTLQAIRRFGPWHGGWMGAKRIARCHPFGTQGFDPVPVIRIRRIALSKGPSSSRLKGHHHHSDHDAEAD